MFPALEHEHLPTDEGCGGKPDDDRECVRDCDLLRREAWLPHIAGIVACESHPVVRAPSYGDATVPQTEWAGCHRRAPIFGATARVASDARPRKSTFQPALHAAGHIRLSPVAESLFFE